VRILLRQLSPLLTMHFKGTRPPSDIIGTSTTSKSAALAATNNENEDGSQAAIINKPLFQQPTSNLELPTPPRPLQALAIPIYSGPNISTSKSRQSLQNICCRSHMASTKVILVSRSKEHAAETPTDGLAILKEL